MNLLYPNGKEHTKTLSQETYQHLALEELVDLVGVTTEEKTLLRSVFTVIPTDYETVIFRQEILKDFLEEEEFCAELEEVLRSLDVLAEYNRHNMFTVKKKSSLWELIDYMVEMEIYIKIIEEMLAFFERHEVASKGLKEIAGLLTEVLDTERIEELKEIVQSLRADISTLKSVTIGINLSPELRPEEIRILGFESLPYRSQFDKINLGASIAAHYPVRYRESSQFMKYICDDMEKELSKNVQHTKKMLKSYINLKGYFLLDICNDLKYYLMMAKFTKKLIATGLGVSIPHLDEKSDTITIKGIYNVRLMAREVEEIVKNDFSFSEKEKLYILTGPNRGGKTMLTQAIGLNALFAAQGLFVTADSYDGYLFEDIMTHFPADENETLNLGRLGEEAVRVQKIVKDATPKTLVLLNETYSSTSAFDGLYLAKDLVHILKHKNVPMVFNTHIHDLACETKEMNQWDGPSDVVSLTMEIVDRQTTFRVLRKEPDRCSYAKNIAEKYGVTYEQMLECRDV